MKKFFLHLLLSILTFAVGVVIYRNASPDVSLEHLTEYTAFYDGMDVEIETYVQLESFDDNLWYIGEPFEKNEVWTNLDLTKFSGDLENLHSQLKRYSSKESFRRVKVLVRGTVEDNCRVNTGSGVIFRCCFGRSMVIQAKEIVQIGTVEEYNN